MKVLGQNINADQVKAAVAAMTGYFTTGDIAAALTAAGVTERDGEVANHAAVRLIKRESDAGRIRARPDNHWEVMSE